MITREPETEAQPTPILFIHGAWHAAWCWEENFLPYFASQGYSSHALSLSNHGGSDGRKRLFWTGIKDYIEDVAEAAAKLEKPPVLVGHSMGGWIIQKYLERYSAPAVVLLAPVPVKGCFRFGLRMARHQPLTYLRTLVTLNPYLAVGDPDLARYWFFSADMDKEKLMEYFPNLQNESYRAVQEMFFFSLPKPQKVKKTPMLLLDAANDRTFTVEEERETARAYGAQFEIFPGMAHDMMLEEGWQDVADKIIAWLREQGL
ncbi:MAG: alpha/beta fold hydrolase [Actinobacteria bacterium]|nr:alpha/beta fold hydrolase [Actinomycetota bacterium]